MKTLHLTGHFQKWNLDAHFQNGIGAGFVFCAFSFPEGFFSTETINSYNKDQVLQKSFFDLQFYGKKKGAKLNKGKLKTYDFHPAVIDDNEDATNIFMETAVKKGISYQIKSLKLDKIIIPNYYENEKLDDYVSFIRTINNWLVNNKKPEIKYFMSIVLSHHTIIDEYKIDRLLYALTDQSMVFDGYYIACEAKPEIRHKISVDFKYLKNLTTVFKVLTKQKFEVVHSYANWDALIFLALSDLNYITIGTYENLRNFSIKRFTEDEDGGPSKGFYFSEKLLNFIKSPLLDLIKSQKCLDLIRNERNIFSDAVLAEGFSWSNQKPEVHKNYLLAIDRLLNELAAIPDLEKRKQAMLRKIESAEKVYQLLEDKGVYLQDESKNYHLSTWKSFLLAQK